MNLYYIADNGETYELTALSPDRLVPLLEDVSHIADREQQRERYEERIRGISQAIRNTRDEFDTRVMDAFKAEGLSSEDE